MRRILQIASWTALAGVIIPPCVFLGGGMDLSVVKVWMLVASVLWFVTVPFWMGRTDEP
ncbi:MAG TPA: hypothetical protein VGA56_19425 [Opitutaceae bacterium]